MGLFLLLVPRYSLQISIRITVSMIEALVKDSKTLSYRYKHGETANL